MSGTAIDYIWHISAWTIAFALAVVIFREHRRCPRPGSALVYMPPARMELLAALVLIAIGLILRFAFLGELFDGRLSSDEDLVSVIYTSTVAHGEQSRNGATHLAFALALDLWYKVFNFSPLSARTFSASLGTIGLIFFFLGLRCAAGVRLALWSTAFLSVSLYGVYFSKLALETGWVLSIPPVVFFLAISASQKRSPLLAASAGLIFSLGLFSYPGMLLATLSVAVGMTLSYLVYRRSMKPQWWRSAHWWIMILAFVAGSIPFTVFAFLQHSNVLGGGGQALLMGGGGLSFSVSSILSGWYQVLYDLLINANSWYLPYRGMSFLETALLPLGIYGIYMFWRTGQRWLWIGFFLAIPVCIAIVPFTGHYPGMRRALFVLLPYSVALGGGMIFFLNAVTARQGMSTLPEPGWNPLPYQLIPLSVLIFAVAHPIVYQFTTGQDQSMIRGVIADGFGKARIPFNFILHSLKTRDIVLDHEEFTVGYFDDLIYTHYPRLYNRYNPASGVRHRVMAVPYDDLPKFVDKMLITWNAHTIGQLAASGRVCIPLESLSPDSANLPYWGVLTSEREGCYDSAELMKTPGPEMVMAFDKVNRLKHQFHCVGNYCGPERNSFIYSIGGDVIFLLTAVSHDVAILRLEVINPDAGRESLIFVNDVFVGPLTVAGLDASGKFADYIIPLQARRPPGSWVIRISPSADPSKLGWDIAKAKLQTK